MAEEIITPSPGEQRSQGKKKKRISWKAIGITVGIVVLVVGIVYGVIRFMRWRNDGSAYADKLGEQIGVSSSTAQKYAHITLQNASAYACVNMAAADYPHLFESTKTTDVLGVTIPQWVIYIAETNDTVTDVIYYDYTKLEKFGTGVKVKAEIDTAGITKGMTREGVHEYIPFGPLRTAYEHGKLTESYKYYFNDQNTGNTVAYTITVTYGDNQVTNVEAEENYFILSALTAQ